MSDTADQQSKPPALPSKRDSTIPAGWSYYGCVEESWDERLLEGFAFSSSALTPLQCLTECQRRGYTLAGTEYGDECYCGNEFVGSGGNKTSDAECDMPCQGDSTETCGEAWLLSMYSYSGSNSSGSCTTTTVSTDNSTSTSVAATSTATSPVETSNSTLVADPTPSNATASNTTEIANATATVSSSIVSDAATTASTTATATTTSSAASASVTASDSSEWYALGCAIDTSSRILSGYALDGQSDMTIDSCLELCEDQGYSFAGVEFGDECYCGNSIPGNVTYSDDACNVVCSGDSSETCGGSWALDLYELVSSNSSCDTTSAITSVQTGVAIVKTSSSLTATEAATTTSKAAATATESVATAKSSSTTATTETAKAASSSSVAATTTTSSSASVTSVAASSSSIPASSATHYVWAHHMVGNTYPYTESTWLSDIQTAAAAGIDGFALNMGSDSWQPDRVADAYSAAESYGTDFKLFLSLDMTSLGCGSSSAAANLVSLVSTHASHPNQAKYDGKVLVSTFAGSDCTFGSSSSDAWESLFISALSAAGVDIFFVPSVFSDISTFSSDSWMDGELNWNSAWPMSSTPLSESSTDASYISALGSKAYMPAISPFFFTHFGANSWNKNWLYMSDDWLYASRWEQVIAMRDEASMTEILTWNDYGESSYIGPIEGALPSGSDAWVDGFDHTDLLPLTKYYATAFKTGAYPAVTEDKVFLWSRPHTHDATASDDSVGRPTNWDITEDYLYAVVLATEASTVTLTSGSTTSTFSVDAGLTKLKLASEAGGIGATIARDGSTVASYTSSGFDYTSSPTTYNYNYFVGSS